MKKYPINIESLQGTETPSTAQACLDYLFLEHEAKRNELEQHILQNYEQRLQTGESVLIKITDIFTDEHTDETKVTATVDYNKLPYSKPDRVLSSLRHKDSDGNSAGEFVMGIPIDRTGTPIVDKSLNNIGEFPRFIVESIDKTNISDGEMEMTLSISEGQAGTAFIYRKPWVNAASDSPRFEPGDMFILDPSPDDYTSASAYQVLNNDEYNSMTSLFDKILHEEVDNHSQKFADETTETLIDWMGKSSNQDIHKPNQQQEEIIKSTSAELNLVQGPPGTGKTSGAIAPTIISRMLGFTDEKNPCRTLVTGPSNKAINEVMDEVLQLAVAITEDTSIDQDFSNTLFVRLSDEQNLEHDPGWENIIYTPLYSDEDLDQLIPRFKSRLQTSTITPNPNEHIIIFGTARRTWRLGKKVIDPFVFETSDDSPTYSEKRREEIRDSHRLFDVVVADEASMMTVPDFLTAGAFYDSGGTIIISGDHRQLPPVQQHDWDTEYKPTTAQLPVYFSLLDYCRYLQGEMPVDVTETQKQLMYTPSGTTDIPLHQLEKTYRCHKTVASFLRRWVYKNLDDLSYTSDETATIPNSSTTHPALETILNPKYPLTLVTYPEGTAQQSNGFEAWLTTMIIQSITDPSTVGVVTPHNAQRGLINTQLEDEFVSHNEKTVPASDIVDTDTVERFQGDERDLMILNGTVSDPDYVDSESEFLLNLNRLNVAVSRMKKKCIIIASEAIFNHIPLDKTEYDNAVLWKGLAKDAGLVENMAPDWSGDISTTSPSPPHIVNETPQISIYHVPNDLE